MSRPPYRSVHRTPTKKTMRNGSNAVNPFCFTETAPSSAQVIHQWQENHTLYRNLAITQLLRLFGVHSRMWFPLQSLSLVLLGAYYCSAAEVASGEGDYLDRLLQEDDRVRTDLVRLLPFDVQLAMSGDPANVNIYSLTDIVQEWMSESFGEKAENQALISNSTSFDSLGLELRTNNRRLQDTNTGIQLFTANFEGVTLWERVGSSTPPMDAEIVELIQRSTLFEKQPLLVKLRAADPDSTGLGQENVLDVRAYVATQPSPDPVEEDSNDPLQIVIIIAIVVACLAFGLLMFAVIWAWRSDQSKNQRNYNKSSNKASSRYANSTDNDHNIPPIATQSESYDMEMKSPTGMTPPAVAASTGSEASMDQQPLPSPGGYDGSVISEDISTSLTAYYKSGMSGYATATRPSKNMASNERDFNDNASMSSMDSYGYSLDGYAPSLGPAPQGYPVGGSLTGMIKDPDTDYSEEEDAVSYTNTDKDADYA